MKKQENKSMTKHEIHIRKPRSHYWLNLVLMRVKSVIYYTFYIMFLGFIKL